MAKRVFAGLMALMLLVGTAALVSCGDPAPSEGMTAQEKADMKAKAEAARAKAEAATQNATTP